MGKLDSAAGAGIGMANPMRGAMGMPGPRADNIGSSIGPSPDILSKLFGHAQGRPFQSPGLFAPPGLSNPQNMARGFPGGPNIGRNPMNTTIPGHPDWQNLMSRIG